MASKHAYDQIKSLLETTVSPARVLDWDEIDDSVVQGTEEFYAIEEISGDEDVIGFGDPTNVCNQETGILEINCFTPSPMQNGEASSHRAREMADAVRDAMRHKRPGDVRILVVAPPELARLNEGLWTIGSVSVSFEYNHHSSV